MKKVALIFSLLILALNVTYSQVENKQSKFVKSVDILVGAVPNPDYNALKFDLAVNNVLFKIVGFYASFEVGVASDYFTNTCGIDVSVLRWMYLYAGIDIFTSYGIINYVKDNQEGSIRKELGLGFFPVNNLSLRAGYSLEVGVTFTAGYRITINNKKKNVYDGYINRW